MFRSFSFQAIAAAFSLALLTAQFSHGHGAYHDVVERIEAELKKSPDDAALHYKLAEAHAGHEESKACLKEVSEVERLAPGVYPTGYLRGFSLFIGGENERAKAVLDQFLSTHPDHVDALATRGRVLAKMEHPTEAAADLQAAVKASPSPSGELVTELALAFQKLGKPKEASGALDEALKTSRDAPLLLECALKIETAAGMWDAALGRIDGLQKNAPRPEPWMAKRAELLAKAGRADDARAAWAALRDRLISLPSLERGSPQNSQLLSQARQALGEAAPAPVVVPPAP
jgi:tetratricopeptide (TPR) repeat protein